MNANANIDVRTVPMPPPHRAYFALIGPAIILTGLSQGSGELWLLPRLHANFGLDFTWVIFYGSLFQLPLLVEVMRTTAYTGENPLTVLARRSRVVALLCLLLALFAFLGAAGFILTVGETLFRLFQWPGDLTGDVPKKVWAATAAVLFALPVWFRLTTVQRYLEFVVGTCSALSILLFLGAIALRPELLGAAPEFLTAMIIPRGLSSITDLAPKDLASLVVGFTYMGLGGWYCLFYPVWGRNRQVAIAAVCPPDGSILPALTVSTGDADSQRHCGRWMRAVWLATLAALLGNAFTVVLTSFLAYSLLHGAGIAIGTEWDLVTKQSAFFEPTLGALAPVVFLVAVAAFFLDTWLGTYVSFAQLVNEVLPRLIRRRPTLSSGSVFQILFTGLFIISLAPLVLPVSPGSLLIKWMGITMFCSMPFIGALVFYVNYIYLPRVGPSFYRPSRYSALALLGTTAFYLGAMLWYITLTL